MAIWVIHGTTGEYSDRTEWVVGYVHTKEHAEGIVNYYSALAREIKNRADKEEAGWHTRRQMSSLHPDPQFQFDYTGTDYYATKTEEIKYVFTEESN